MGSSYSPCPRGSSVDSMETLFDVVGFSEYPRIAASPIINNVLQFLYIEQ
jgi:hypothetical protein